MTEQSLGDLRCSLRHMPSTVAPAFSMPSNLPPIRSTWPAPSAGFLLDSVGLARYWRSKCSINPQARAEKRWTTQLGQQELEARASMGVLKRTEASARWTSVLGADIGIPPLPATTIAKRVHFLFHPCMYGTCSAFLLNATVLRGEHVSHQGGKSSGDRVLRG